FECVRGGMAGLLIGEVITREKHPNADKLSLSTVNVVRKEPVKIVCGARNVAEGQKVIVAVPEATITHIKCKPFTNKTNSIRREVSEGMICAEDEIGLGEGHDGIMVLASDAVPGTEASEYFGVQTDHIIEIGLTPNRADATSHIGVARDIRAVTGRPVKWPDTGKFSADNNELQISVDVENT